MGGWFSKDGGKHIPIDDSRKGGIKSDQMHEKGSDVVEGNVHDKTSDWDPRLMDEEEKIKGSQKIFDFIEAHPYGVSQIDIDREFGDDPKWFKYFNYLVAKQFIRSAGWKPEQHPDYQAGGSYVFVVNDGLFGGMDLSRRDRESMKPDDGHVSGQVFTNRGISKNVEPSQFY